MSTRHRPNPPFDDNLPEQASTDWSNPAPAADAQTMHGLHLASQNVLRLATQTYNAAACGDESAAHAARAALAQQLGLATHLIDALLADDADRPTMH